MKSSYAPLVLPVVAAFALLSPAAVFAQSNSESYEVVGQDPAYVPTQTDIPGSGVKANTKFSWTSFSTTQQVALFSLSEPGSPDNIYLKVEITGLTIAAGANRELSVGVFQTTNSQNLKDPGSFSIYVFPGTTGSSSSSSFAWSVDFKFTLYSDVGLTQQASRDLLLTSLDIDYGQRYYLKDSDFGTKYLTDNTKLFAASPQAGYTGYTTGTSEDAQFNDPRYAVAADIESASEFNIRVMHGSVALFMFELRNPPKNVPAVPEPSTWVAMVTGAGLLALYRRRRAS